MCLFYTWGCVFKQKSINKQKSCFYDYLKYSILDYLIKKQGYINPWELTNKK